MKPRQHNPKRRTVTVTFTREVTFEQYATVEIPYEDAHDSLTPEQIKEYVANYGEWRNTFGIAEDGNYGNDILLACSLRHDDGDRCSDDDGNDISDDG